MNIHFLGGSDEVGASCLLVELGGQRLLIDAGIRVSPKARDGLSGELLPDLAPLRDGGLDAVLITHAHADHIGAIPLVLGAMPQVPTYATPATIALMRVMLADALRIMDSRSEQEGELPHYDAVQVAHLEAALRPVSWREPLHLGDTLRVQFFQAGHIPGAASIYLESAEGSLLVSGDLSFSPMRATPQAEVPRVSPDVLILESTYGGRLHANRKAEERRLIEAVNAVLAGGGRVLIPAFALGRAQEVALILDSALAAGTLSPVPVYLDGMTRAITQVFAQHPEALSPAQQRHLETHPTLWRSTGIHNVRNRAERELIAHTPQPAVIIASSGMLTGGASPVYAAQLVSEPQSAIFITGYQDEEAPGKALQKLAAAGGGTLTLEGKKHSVRCQIATYALSAHADENELTQYAAQLEARITYLVHGDDEARSRMQQLLHERQLPAQLVQLGQVLTPPLRPRQKRSRRLLATGVGVGQPLTAPALWEALIAQGLGGERLRLKDLARFWYGDANLGGPELVACLDSAPLYFAPYWRDARQYQVRGPAQVEQHRPRFAWLETLGPLVNHLVLAQGSDDQPLLGVVRALEGPILRLVTASSFDSSLPAERVLLVLEPLPAPPDLPSLEAVQQTLLAREEALQAAAEPLCDLPALAALLDGQPRPLAAIAAHLGLPTDAPTQQAALLCRLLTLGAQGAYGAFTLPARQGPTGQPLEFNAARSLLQEFFPAEAGLRKVSGDLAQQRLTLRFDFPLAAAVHYAEQITQAAALTGWEIAVDEATHTQALEALLRQLLPDWTGRPSLHLAQQRVELKLPSLPPDWPALQATFASQTGFQLSAKLTGDNSKPSSPSPAPSLAVVGASSPRKEINEAFGLLRTALEPLGLYKASLKGDSIVLSFLTPQLAARHEARLRELAALVGYPLQVHPHPNQIALLDLVTRLCTEAGLHLHKTPSLQIDQARVLIRPSTPPPPAVLAALQAQVSEQTGYELALKP